MSEDPTRSSDTTQRADQSPDTADIGKEVREMGQQLENLFRAMIESDRAKQLRRDLTGGVQELTKQIQSALRSAQSDPRFQQAEERGRQVLNQAQQSKVVNDVQETLISGIAQINMQLRRAAERFEQERGATTGGATSQRVPLDVEPSDIAPMRPVADTTETTPISPPPNTGETQRLDDDDQVTG